MTDGNPFTDVTPIGQVNWIPTLQGVVRLVMDTSLPPRKKAEALVSARYALAPLWEQDEEVQAGWEAILRGRFEAAVLNPDAEISLRCVVEATRVFASFLDRLGFGVGLVGREAIHRRAEGYRAFLKSLVLGEEAAWPEVPA